MNVKRARENAVEGLKALGRWLATIVYLAGPVLACAVRALHRLLLLLSFLLLRSLGERRLKRWGLVPRDGQVTSIRRTMKRSFNNFLEDVKAIFEQA